MYYSSSCPQFPTMEQEVTVNFTTAGGWCGISLENYSAIDKILRLYPLVPNLSHELPFALAKYVCLSDESNNYKGYIGYLIMFGYSIDRGRYPSWKCFFQLSLEKAVELGITPLQELVKANALATDLKKVSVVALGCIDGGQTFI